jgi:hypothetical protein
MQLKSIKSIVNYLDHSMQCSLATSVHHLPIIGAMAFLGFPLFYWMWNIWFLQPEAFGLRLIGLLGISSSQLARLFKHFYTTTFMGTGIGLSFCKLVMNRFGGNIRCESIEGQYTKFILSFPVV